MRVVIDTNVLVSALLTPGRTPERALMALAAAGAVTLVDARIEDEYRAVLARPKFAAIDPARREALLALVLGGAERVTVTEAFAGALIDDDDRVFVEVALAGRADAVVTGNLKHYPPGLGVEALAPSALLARIAEG